MKSNLVLIGMPGAGKSTLGVLLAKQMARQFIDTDLLIQQREQALLQQIVDQQGYLALRDIEASVIAELVVEDSLIATGGSAVYSPRAMNALKQQGLVVYLQLPLTVLLERLSDTSQRGLAKRPDQSLDALYQERRALYERYADITIDCENKPIDSLCREISEAVAARLTK